MPEFITRGEQKTAAESVIIEQFYGSGAIGQIIHLIAVPLQPIIVEVYKNSKWVLVGESDYTIAEGDDKITFINDYTIPAAAPPARNKNIQVTYSADPNSVAGSGSPLGIATTITLAGAAPDETVTLALSPWTGMAKIKRVVVVRTAQAGTGYTANSRIFTIYDVGAAGGVVNHLFNEYGLEPSVEASELGQLINQTDLNFGEIMFINTDPTQYGEITIRLQAAGGDGTSTETYSVIVQGEEGI